MTKVEIQRQKMLDFMNYFKDNKLDFNDTQLLEKMQKDITTIFQLEIEELGYRYNPNDDTQSTFELKFVNSPEDNFRGRHNPGWKIQEGKFVQGRPLITYNTSKLYEDLQSSDKEKRLFACKTIFKTVFHEIQHHRQYLMTRTNVSSKEAIQYARDFAIKTYLQKDWYSRDKKTGNYDAYTIENNANEVGYNQYLETIGIEDKKIEDLRVIEEGKLNTFRYKADVDSFDGQQHYDSKGLQERDDVTVPILDNLIKEKNRTEILHIYPILQKEYNLDGSKKTAVELIKNMQKEVQEISENQAFTQIDKKILIQDTQEMYYELIDRQIEKITPEQIGELIEQIGKDEIKEIFSKMSYYFQNQLESRLEKSAQMASARTRIDEFIMPSNNGTIAVEQKGKTVQMDFDEFIKTIDPQLLQRSFNVPAGKNKGEMSAEKFLKKYFFKNISENGKVILKDGSEITAKQYIEQYVLKIKELSKNKPPKRIIMDTIKSESPWSIHKENCERLEKYYNKKIEVLAQVDEKIEQYDKTKEDEQKQRKMKAHKRKMQWIKDFVKDYEDTEQATSYALRANCEEDNIKKVLNSIKTGRFIEDFKNITENDKKDPKWYMGKLAPAMARLLKEADNLTINGGINYVEQFTKIPEVNKILVQIRDSEYAKQTHKKAEENRRTGNIPKHHRTMAEKDKQNAQNYLISGNLTRGSVKDEIDYRRGLTNRSLLKVSDEVKKENISTLRKQQISLERVLARQDGKTPSEMKYNKDKKMWYCITDIQAQKSKQQNSIEPHSTTSSYDNDYITPETIKKDTSKIGLQEINTVIQDTKQLQNQRTNKQYKQNQFDLLK